MTTQPAPVRARPVRGADGVPYLDGLAESVPAMVRA
jgi:hypothetical protein